LDGFWKKAAGGPPGCTHCAAPLSRRCRDIPATASADHHRLLSLFETGPNRMTKRQARPDTASAASAASPAAARPASLAGAEKNPRPTEREPSATATLPLFSRFFLGAWAGKPAMLRGRK
jgi:hypothetical protein